MKGYRATIMIYDKEETAIGCFSNYVTAAKFLRIRPDSLMRGLWRQDKKIGGHTVVRIYETEDSANEIKRNSKQGTHE